MKRERSALLLSGFVVGLMVLGGVAIINWQHIALAQEAEAWVAHTHETRASRSLLFSLLLDLDSAERAYVLAGQPVSRYRVEKATSQIAQQERRLEELTQDEGQKAHLASLRPLVVERLEFARKTMALRNSSARAGGRETEMLAGLNLTERIRELFALMDARSDVLLNQRSALARQGVERTRRLMLEGTCLGFTLLIAAFALVLREGRLRKQVLDELDRLFTVSLDMLCIASADGYFKRISPSFTRTLGFGEEEILARPFLDFVHPDDHAATLIEVEKQVAAGQSVLDFENRYRHKDGSWRVLSWKSIPQPGGLMYASARDVTEQNLAEETIVQLNAELGARASELEAANKELEAFAYSVSHDLRAPLRGMDGFSQALLEDYAGQIDATGRDYLHRIRAGAQRMGLLIDDLLNLSRVTRTGMEQGPVDLTALAHKVIAELQQEQSGRAVLWSVSDPLTGHGDPRLLRLLLQNLLANALKFTGKREQARIEFGEQAQSGEHVFFVRDNGAGFDMVYADRLFGAFQRLHTSLDFPGTGIGLAIVQRVIQRHGGRVWAEAQPGKGATFYFTLPNNP